MYFTKFSVITSKLLLWSFVFLLSSSVALAAPETTDTPEPCVLA